MTKGLAHSVHVRLVQHAKKFGIDPNVVLVRYASELRGDTELSNLLRSAVEAMKGEDGAALMGRIGHYIANNSSLSPKNYGYARWSDLIRATEYFEEVAGENHQPSFREKKAGKRLEPGIVVVTGSD